MRKKPEFPYGRFTGAEARGSAIDAWEKQMLGWYKDLEKLCVKICSQHADDRCWMDLTELAEAVGVDMDMHVGDPEAMLKNCERFVNEVCVAGGPWKSYAELEQHIQQLERELQANKQVRFGLIARNDLKFNAIFSAPTGQRIGLITNEVTMNDGKERIHIAGKTTFNATATDVFLTINGIPNRLFVDINVELSSGLKHIWLEDGPVGRFTQIR